MSETKNPPALYKIHFGYPVYKYANVAATNEFEALRKATRELLDNGVDADDLLAVCDEDTIVEKWI